MPKKLGHSVHISEIAERVKGQIRGKADTHVSGLCSIEEPSLSHLAFIREKNPRRAAQLMKESGLKAFLIYDEAFSEELAAEYSLVITADPQRALIACIDLFYEPYQTFAGIHPKAEIDPSAHIGRRVSIGAFCVVGAFAKIQDGAVLHPHVVIYPGASVGARTIIHSHAVVREDCIIGDDAVIQNGAVIGSDGFGFIMDPAAGLIPVPQVGTVKLLAKVDVGANACIDRATLGTTSIGVSTKLDNLVQVGHNTKIGKFSILCGQAGVAGSCVLGDQVVLGGNAGIADHITIGSGVRFAAKAGVTGDILEKGDYGGHPAVPINEWRRSMVALRSGVKKKRAKEKR